MPLRHGHAISVDMAYSATLAYERGNLPEQDYKRLLNLFSRAGLSMDQEDFTEDILDKATQAILKTRDGKLRAAIPAPLGDCIFLNDVTPDEMNAALRKHKEVVKNYPRNGLGLEAYVDASDTGYTQNEKPAESNGMSSGLKNIKVLNDDAAAVANGDGINGHSNGVNGKTNGVKAATKHASGPEGVDGLQGRPDGHLNGCC